VARHRLHELADELAELPARATARAADRVAELAADEARRATGDGRMSGMGRRGPQLRAVAAIRTRGRSTTAEIRGVPAGAWAILQSGAVAHVIVARRGRVLSGPGMRHPVRAPVRHPGARGKRTWGRVLAQARAEVPELVADDVADIVR
jgi:hypothetical protein